MNRRLFIKNSLAASAAVAGINNVSWAAPSKEKILSAYYFRAHTYTMVPGQVREDLTWMADHGTNAVCPAILEQDLFAAVENIEIICNEAEKLGMQVLAVPSRWGGLIAGAPKVPSLFTIKNPDTYVMMKDGTPYSSRVSGRISSFHHPATLEFFKAATSEMLRTWNIKGVIWDEPKMFDRLDYSPAAQQALSGQITRARNIQAFADFWSKVNEHIKSNHPEVSTHFFIYAQLAQHDDVMQSTAKIDHLDYYGCDGAPWHVDDQSKKVTEGKNLLGDDAGEKFLRYARQNHKKSLWLLENLKLDRHDIELMDQRLPEILDSSVDHLIYYYYPRSLKEPDLVMNTLAKHIKKWK